MTGFAETLSERGWKQAMLRHSMLKAVLAGVEAVKDPTDEQKAFGRLLFASLFEIEELLSEYETLTKARSKANG